MTEREANRLDAEMYPPAGRLSSWGEQESCREGEKRGRKATVSADPLCAALLQFSRDCYPSVAHAIVPSHRVSPTLLPATPKSGSLSLCSTSQLTSREPTAPSAAPSWSCPASPGPPRLPHPPGPGALSPPRADWTAECEADFSHWQSHWMFPLPWSHRHVDKGGGKGQV